MSFAAKFGYDPSKQVVDPVRVESRKSGREKAATTLALMVDMLGEKPFKNKDEEESFWTAVRNEALKKAPLGEDRAAISPRTMTITEALNFEQTTVPWGIHKDKKVKDVPLSYLDKLMSGKDNFIKAVDAYLRNQAIAHRLERELSLGKWRDENDME